MTDTLETPPLDPPRLATYNAQRIGFTAGVVAAAIMLLAIVVLRLLSGIESLPEIFAEGILVNLPGALFSAVLDSLQHSAKPLFYLAIGIGMLAVGGFLGRLFAARPTWQRAVQIVLGVWVFFGVLVYTLLGGGIFGQYLQAGPVWHGGSLLVVFGVFGVALWHAYAWLAHRALPAVPDQSRRVFLRNAAVAMVATVGAGSIWRLMFGGDAGDTTPTVPSGALPAAASPPNAPPFDLKGMSPEVTDVTDFYTVSKNVIDPA